MKRLLSFSAKSFDATSHLRSPWHWGSVHMQEIGGHEVSISKTRSRLYKLARILGDLQALTSPKPSKTVPRRIARRVAGRASGKILKSLFGPLR